MISYQKLNRNVKNKLYSEKYTLYLTIIKSLDFIFCAKFIPGIVLF